jgi:hypothetical protein
VIARICIVGANVTHGYWPKWAALAWFGIGFLALIAISSCRQGVPVLDVAPKPVEANGTISGTVNGPEGTSAIEGRLVEAINLDTGERQKASTNSAGGFSFKLRPGKYRVEVALQEGESLVKHPGVIDLTRSDVDTHAEFVVGSAKVSRPHNSYRADDGLGAPIA